MRFSFLIATFLIYTYSCSQQIDTFHISHKSVKPLTVQFDTFVQATYLSDETEIFNRIVYKNGFKIISPNSLILFKATKSYIDSFGISEDRNASIGSWINAPYTRCGDTLMFIVKETYSSPRSARTTTIVTKGYSSVLTVDSVSMEINTTSDSNEVPPKVETKKYKLYRKDYLITGRR